MLAQAESLRSQAVDEFSAGRPASARRLIGRALLLLDGAVEPEALSVRARVQVSRALTEFERAGLAAGLDALREAVDLCQQAEALDIMPVIHSQRATLLLRSGHLAGALAELNQAAAHLERLPPRDQVVLLLNRGTLFLQKGSLEEARRDLSDARRLGTTFGSLDLARMAQHNLGYLAYVAGHLPESLRQLRAASADATDIAPWVPLDHGRVLLEAGLLREAQARFAAAERLAAERGLKHERGEALVEGARASLLLGDLDDARAQSRLARRLFQRRGSEGWRDQAELVAVISDVVSGRRSAAAAAAAVRLTERFAEAGADDLASYASLLGAEAALTGGDLERASALMSGSEAGFRTLSFSRRLYADLVRAKLADARNDRAKARAIMRRASDGLAHAQARSSSLDVRAAVALHGRRLGDFALGLAIDEGSAARAFEASERWQAISNRLPPVEPPEDPELAEMTSQLRQLREQTRGVSAERNEVTERIAALERRIREKDWHGAGSESGAVTKPLKVTAIQHMLSVREADMVSFFSHGGLVHAVVITRRISSLVAVAEEAEILELARRIQADLIAANQPRIHPAIASSVRASLARRLSEVDAALLRPLSLTRNRLVVVPSYAVAGLPWGMLPSRIGRPTTVARSATTWASANLPAGPGGTDVYAVAGPGLALGDDEVDAVAAVWPSAVAVHAKESTEVGLVQALRSRSVVHIAAHGEHEAENPLFSSVRLSDGVLFAHELQRGGVTAEHVILSACDVGRATIRPGDEALGLTASLLALGAKNVVAAVAPVPDAVAHRVMIAYHENLAGGLDVSAALAQASLVDDLGGLFCSFGSDWIRT